MGVREPLTLSEKEAIWRGKLAGERLVTLAQRLGCSYACARKWWRVGRDHGQNGLQAARRGRGTRGLLSGFAPAVVTQALALKQTHRRWGADRVRVELGRDPQFSDLRLPSRSRLSVFFRAQAALLPVPARSATRLAPVLPRAAAPHEEWQLDAQEKRRLADGTIATVCTIRDPYAGAFLASQAFAVQTARHYRKLTWEEVRGVLRAAFTEWRTLPDRLRTDNELCLAGAPTDPFPSKLTLWLTGLGIYHQFIRPRCPTDQAQVERGHRTLAAWTESAAAGRDLPSLQAALNHERTCYNTEFPARASACQQQAPLRAFPALRQPRRAFDPAAELALFDLQRVYDYLATFTFERKVNSTARVSLGRQMYSLGRAFVRQHQISTVQATFDPESREWRFSSAQTPEVLRRPLKGMSVAHLTGLSALAARDSGPIQLGFPVFAPP